jgi:hypothetical protein
MKINCITHIKGSCENKQLTELNNNETSYKKVILFYTIILIKLYVCFCKIINSLYACTKILYLNLNSILIIIFKKLMKYLKILLKIKK